MKQFKDERDASVLSDYIRVRKRNCNLLIWNCIICIDTYADTYVPYDARAWLIDLQVLHALMSWVHNLNLKRT